MPLVLDGSLGADLVQKIALPSSKMPAGSVLQIVQTVKTNIFSTTSTTFTDVTGFSVTITPSATTSKIMVIFSATLGGNMAADGGVRLLRDSTVLLIGDAAGSRYQGTSGLGTAQNNQPADVCKVYVDSPNTVSAVTYKLQMKFRGGSMMYMNMTERDGNTADYDGRFASTITAMEIAG